MKIDKTSFQGLTGYFMGSNNMLWAILIGFALIFTLFLFPNLTADKYSYKLGDIAKKDIKSPRDFFVEDKDATEMNRLQAARSVLSVYDMDSGLAKEIANRLRNVFKEFRVFIEKDKHADKSKSHLEKIISNTKNQGGAPKSYPHHPSLMLDKKVEFEQKIGISLSNEAFLILEKNKFSVSAENLMCKLFLTIMDTGVVDNKEVLLRQSEKGISIRYVDDLSNERVEQGLKQFYGLEQAQAMVRVLAEPLVAGMENGLKDVLIELVQRLIQPNLTLNRVETEAREKKAEMEIGPSMFKVKAGEMLLREGERVSRPQLQKLKALQTQTRNENVVMRSLGVGLLLLLLTFTVYVLNLRPKNELGSEHNKNMLFLMCILVFFLFIAKISLSVPRVLNASLSFNIQETAVFFGMPITACAMTVCLFMGLETALPFSIVFSALVSILFENRFDIFIYYFLSSTMAAFWTKDCCERKVFIKAGTKLGLMNVLFSTALVFYNGDYSLHNLIWSWIFAFSGGLSAGIVTAGFAPLVEIIFDYTTDIKLLELANLEQPILRRLMIEAPGTYNHSVIVGTMADAVASEIGANPLLARVCGYYHDIGKIDKAQYFIENQQQGKNKHDKLAPSMSALILTGHVKNGVEMAKKYRLGKPIIDTIKQHHGTSLIEYFFEKAKSQRVDNDATVNPADYRYPGPKPQTVEAGIVMIADIVEAASRSLDDPTPARIQGLVQRLINKIFSDGQLDNCEITLKDLHKIAKRFNQILSGIHHHRIKYPEKTTAAGIKVKNGDSDRQQTARPSHGPGEDSDQSSGHLKRLGID